MQTAIEQPLTNTQIFLYVLITISWVGSPLWGTTPLGPVLLYQHTLLVGPVASVANVLLQ